MKIIISRNFCFLLYLVFLQLDNANNKKILLIGGSNRYFVTDLVVDPIR